MTTPFVAQLTFIDDSSISVTFGDMRPPQVDEYENDSEDDSFENEDHDIAPPTGALL